jgi:hypothetical protein
MAQGNLGAAQRQGNLGAGESLRQGGANRGRHGQGNGRILEAGPAQGNLCGRRLVNLGANRRRSWGRREEWRRWPLGVRKSGAGAGREKRDRDPYAVAEGSGRLQLENAGF